MICGATDILDGSIARLTKHTSAFGAALDSIADFIFIMVMLYIMIPIIDIYAWIQLWLICISIVKLMSLLIGFARHHSLAFLHTYMNKFAGALLFAFPLLYDWLGMSMTAILLCSISSIAAVEEMAINLTAKELSQDVKSIF